MRFFAAFLIFVSLTACAYAGNGEGAQPTLPQAPLVIETGKGEVSFTVEMAITPRSQMTGMMFRTEVAPDAGMLFIFPGEEHHSFWMKNTLIPLDMIFIRSNGKIARIARQTTPQSLRLVSSGEPVKAVLEIGGGRAAELEISEGDLVRHAAFGNAP